MHTLTQWDINYFNPVVLQVVSFFYFADKKETRLSSENQNKAADFNCYSFAFVCALFNLKISEQVSRKHPFLFYDTLPYLSVYPVKGFTLPCIESGLTEIISQHSTIYKVCAPAETSLYSLFLHFTCSLKNKSPISHPLRLLRRRLSRG